MLSTVSSIKGISFKNTSGKSANETIQSIFSKLDLEKNKKIPSKEMDKMDELREYLLPKMIRIPTIFSFMLVFVFLLILMPIEISLMYLVIVVMFYVILIYYPKIKEQKSYSDLNQELPYALRHMGIELKSGKGLHDTLLTIKDADYGTFSKEINRVLEEVKFGKSTEESLLDMSKRIKSDGLTRAVQQIVGTLRVGGNLANSLEIIAKDISFEMQIKLKEYSQKLNSFILIYTFIAILAPVISLIMLMAGSTVMGDIISSNVLFLMYGAFFPMIVMFMGIFIKKLEPKI
ncbi:type II secretion system F family protein [Methanobrevibacter sp.]|uniref:type II secretion system F family protein n=1 Tax=Methanobrevibacter sp. TaxID=66852 RepID=UPI00388EAC10